MTGRQCMRCTRYFVDPDKDVPVCLAFPNGIPVEIYTGEVDHSEPFKGDNGLQFDDMGMEHIQP